MTAVHPKPFELKLRKSKHTDTITIILSFMIIAIISAVGLILTLLSNLLAIFFPSFVLPEVTLDSITILVFSLNEAAVVAIVKLVGRSKKSETYKVIKFDFNSKTLSY